MENLHDTEVIKGEEGDSNIEYVALSGGGVAGAAFTGVIQALDKLDMRKHIKCWSGSSIGAIVCVLAAGGMTGDEIRDILVDVRAADLVSVPSTWTAIFRSVSIFNHFGLNDSEKSAEWFSEQFKKIGVTKDTTFWDFYELTGVKVVIAASSISTYQTYYFSASSSPFVTVFEAINATIAYPFIFKPQKFRDVYLVDGGMLDNLPLFIYDVQEGGQVVGYNRKAVGFFLEPWDDIESGSSFESVMSYVARVSRCISGALQYKMISHPYMESRICMIGTESLQTFSVEATREDLEKAADMGAVAAERFLLRRLEQDPLPRNLFIQCYKHRIENREPYTSEDIDRTPMNSQFLDLAKTT